MNSAVNEVAAQYSKTIINMNSDLVQKDDQIPQLELLLQNMKKPATNLEENTTEGVEDEINFDGDSTFLSGTERSGASNTNAAGLYIDPRSADTEGISSKE